VVLFLNLSAFVSFEKMCDVDFFASMEFYCIVFF